MRHLAWNNQKRGSMYFFFFAPQAVHVQMGEEASLCISHHTAVYSTISAVLGHMSNMYVLRLLFVYCLFCESYPLQTTLPFASTFSACIIIDKNQRNYENSSDGHFGAPLKIERSKCKQRL